LGFFIFNLCLLFTLKLSCICVFGESVSVMEGDSVTLHTDLTKIHKHDDILWYFGPKMDLFLIAKIYREKQIVDGRFRDRLKLDHQTGSLTITNITTQHTGLYEVKIGGARRSTKTFSVSVYGVIDISQSYNGLPLVYIVLISAGAAGALLIAVALGIFCICRKQRKREQQGKYFLLL
uniref:Immunoglobulin domain-containing protein n=1 Tax=Sinocyclocheilus anshuiensis TaxID=1608454 RepID=A0A671R1A5_9TELE